MSLSQEIKKWILLVDDDSELLDLYESFLEMNFGDSIKIIKVRDGVEATNKLPFQAFDLIITDLNMPKKSGQAFIQAVKESHMNQHTPIVVVSGEDPDEVDQQKVTVLIKPVDQQKYIEVVANQLKLGRTDQRVAADLLNTFIESGIYLLDKAGDLNQSEQLSPEPKADGVDIEGDFMELITISVGRLKNSFLFSFDEGIVKQLASKAEKGDSKDELKKLVHAAGDTIARYSIRRYKNANINIVKESSIEKDSEEYKRIRKAKGIKIPIMTPLGTMHIYGLMQF